MISKRALAVLLAACSTASACAPSISSPAGPRPATVVGSIATRAPELLGEPAGVPAAPARVAARDILGTAAYDLPVEANTWVEAELDFLVGQRREVIALWLTRGAPYERFIKENLAASGVPTDLYHLAMIESGFVPTAKSHAGAVGWWQFMPGTARALGLRVDTLIDERMDPVRSTRAAARHLRTLRREMGDWALAAAAYNAGSGRIGRGLKTFGAVDFWDLAQRGDLAAETRRYVPRLYAVTVIGRSRERFGFKDAPAAAAFSFDSIQVEYATPLGELAKLGASEDRLARLNPHLVQRVTPAGGYWVWVPEGMGVTMQRAWLASEFRKEQGYGTYTVRKGDTLGKLAELGDTQPSRIRELNSRVDFDDLQIGAKLRLPYQAAKRLASRASARESDEPTTSATPGPMKTSTSDADTVVNPWHVVKTGESLWGIARRYRSTVEAIQTANDLGEKPLQPGQLLTIPPAE